MSSWKKYLTYLLLQKKQNKNKKQQGGASIREGASIRINTVYGTMGAYL